jgi:sugar phosphate isomerase/epimerase
MLAFLLATLLLPPDDVFREDNLVAWCIVPFDAKQRGPVKRVALLKQLGFRRYAYDWRDKHLPTFEQELQLLKKEGITLQAVWFPATLNKQATFLLDALKRQGMKTELWVSPPDPQGDTDTEKIKVVGASLGPIVDAAERVGSKVALYNHGGWLGEPQNQLAVIKELNRANVGVVYNLHHGHAHLERFPQVLQHLKPHLTCLNLNGMVTRGDQLGKKILPVGAGDLDLQLLRTIRDSGYNGPIGILGHTQDDVELRLRDNLDGLVWLTKQLRGEPAGPAPRWRTYKP